jgi:excisionase family DNA binding protein
MPIEMDREAYLNTSEACQYLGVSRETLNNYVNAGRLHRYKRGIGRTAYYKRSDLDRFLEMRREDAEDNH